MGRPSNTEERRRQIVRGLLTVMAERGYESASVIAIARAAHLAPGLLHYHFKSKQEVLVALVDELAARFAQRLGELDAAAGDDPARRLDAWIDAALALGPGADRDTVNAWVFVGAEALRQAEVRAVYQANVRERMAQLHGRVRDALRSKGRSTRPARKIAASLLCAVEGAYQLGAAAREIMPSDFAASTVRQAARALVAGEPR